MVSNDVDMLTMSNADLPGESDSDGFAGQRAAYH